MINFGTHLLAALFAGVIYWFILWVCGKLSAPGWLSTIVSGAMLVYFFWFFTEVGAITIGR